MGISYPTCAPVAVFFAAWTAPLDPRQKRRYCRLRPPRARCCRDGYHPGSAGATGATTANGEELALTSPPPLCAQRHGLLGNVEGEKAPGKIDVLRPRKSSVASFINASSDKRIRKKENEKEGKSA